MGWGKEKKDRGISRWSSKSWRTRSGEKGELCAQNRILETGLASSGRSGVVGIGDRDERNPDRKYQRAAEERGGVGKAGKERERWRRRREERRD
jgi:hypothetical protein